MTDREIMHTSVSDDAHGYIGCSVLVVGERWTIVLDVRDRAGEPALPRNIEINGRLFVRDDDVPCAGCSLPGVAFVPACGLCEGTPG